MSFGSATDLSDGSGQDLYTTMCYDPDGQQTLALYKGSSGYLRARVFTISGTSVSGGTPTTVYSGSWYSSKIVYDTSDNRAIVFYEAGSNSNAPRIVPGIHIKPNLNPIPYSIRYSIRLGKTSSCFNSNCVFLFDAF